MRKGMYRQETFRGTFLGCLGTTDHVHFWQIFMQEGILLGAFFMRQGTGRGKAFRTPPSLL